MTQQRKIWELQHTTICKVVGMALDLEDLKKVGRKFHLIFKETCVDEEFVMHSAIVGICDKDSRISRHVQKLIEEHFQRYVKRLSRRDAGEITELVLNGKPNRWDAAMGNLVAPRHSVVHRGGPSSDSPVRVSSHAGA